MLWLIGIFSLVAVVSGTPLDEYKESDEIDEIVAGILKHVTNGDEEEIWRIEDEYHPITRDDEDCYNTVVDYFSNQCFNIDNNIYAYEHLYKFANICVTKYKTADDVMAAIKEQCGGK